MLEIQHQRFHDMDKKYLIGSRAIFENDKSFKLKENADYDVISKEPIDGFEFHDIDFLNNMAMTEYDMKDPILINGHEVHVISMKGLSIIKRSHLWRDLSFDKHITMYHKYLAKESINYNVRDRLILKERTGMSYTEFKKESRVPLNKSKKDFFNDAIVRVYDHDYLHDLVKYYDLPLYTRMTYGDSVFCSKEKWDKMPYVNKLRCVTEEIMVTAIERWLVPHEWNYPVKLAYLNAMKKTCTTMTSGWFRDFAIDNYHNIFCMYDPDIFDRARSELK